MLRRIYRNFLFKRAWKRYKACQPKMVYGVINQGKKLVNTRISTSSTINSEANLTLDDDVFIGHFNFIEASNGIEIKKGTQITNYISILTHSSHVSIRLYRENYRNESNLVGYKKGKVVIEEYSFIGPHSTIMPDTFIGKGSLVQSHSLVKGTYPDFSIIAGNPAVRIGDTRDLDQKFLEAHDILKKTYSQWAKSEE
ncbi:acyltransferase [Halocola ammonii]